MDEFINDLSDKVSKCTDPVFEINTVFEHKIFDGVLKLQLEGNYDAELKLLLSLLSKNDLTFIQKLMINQNISTCYRCLNDFNSALPYAKQFVKLNKVNESIIDFAMNSESGEIKKIRYETYLISLEELYLVYMGMKNFSKAFKIVNNSLEMIIKYDFKDSELHGNVVMNAGAILQAIGKYNEALIEFNKAKIILSKYKTGNKFLLVNNELAACYSKLGQFDEMLATYKEVRDNYKNSRTTNPDCTLRSMVNLAIVYCSFKQYEIGIPLFEEAVSLCKELYGENVPRTLDTIKEFNFVREEANNPRRELVKISHYYRICNTCEKIKEAMDNCTACAKVWYCDKECQLKDWPNHKHCCSVCFYCETPIDREIKFLRCSRCKNVKYCNVECQKNDWKVHKKNCK
jgi:tetratricopeptide (TPR) repeat protein